MSPKSFLARVTATVVVAVALSHAPAPATAAEPTHCAKGLGVGLVDTGAVKDPRAQVYVIANVSPGATFTRRFQVCNGTGGPITVKLYGGDATIAKGAFSVTEGRTQGDIAQWATVDPPQVSIPDQQRIIATATFHVPANATEGERYGVLLAELPTRPGAGGVGIASRVGVRVYLQVGKGGDPRSDFVVDSLQAVRRADGTPAVLARVRNTGQRALDMRGTLQLSHGPGGLSAGPFGAQVGTTLAPGDSAPVVVPLDKAIRGGPWHAVIDMKSGLLERKAAGDITFPDQAATASPAVKAKALPLYKDKNVVVPIAGGLVGLLLLLLLALALREWLRRRKRTQP